MAPSRRPGFALLACLTALACGAEPTTSLDAGVVPDTGTDRTDPDAGAGRADAAPARDAGTTGLRRLVLQVVQASDGQPSGAVSLFDRQLDSPCSVSTSPGADDDRFCGPTTPAFITYLDDRCTMKFVATQARAGTVVLAYDWGGPTRALRVGPAVAPEPTQRWTAQARGGCRPLDASTAATPGAVYAIAETWTDEELPQGRLVTDDDDPQLRVQRFVSDEGLSVVLSLVDRTSGAACRPGATSAGDRCVPDLDVPDQPIELDATCTRPTLLQYGIARVAQVPDRTEYLRFEVQDWSSEVEVGRLVDGRCVVERRALGRMTHHVGTPYPPSAWPRLRREATMSRSGLTQTSVTLSSGTPLGRSLGLELGMGLVDGLSYDGFACGPTWVDGVLRCVPGSAQTPGLFADSRCSVPAAGQVPSGARTARMLLEDGDARTAWLPRGELRALGARRSGPRFVAGPEGCVSWGEGERVLLGERLSVGGLPALVVQFE